MSALLPCPFCGAAGRIVPRHDEKMMEDWAWAGECSECEIALEIQDTEAAAIAAWNRRAPGADHIADAGKMVPVPTCKSGLQVGYTAGAEAMREAAQKVAMGYPIPDDARGAEEHGRCMASLGIAAAIRALPLPTGPASAWRTMDSAPRDGTRVLCFAPAVTNEYPNPKWRVDVWRGNGWWEMRPDQPYTHWQPLPEPPAE